MNIAEILRTRATTSPEALAIIETRWGRPRSLTFAELELSSARVATLLQQAGLQPGEAVLVLQPMSAALYLALSAIFRLGLVAMFLDPGQGQAHIEQCCALQRPRALIASAKAHLLRLVSPALRAIPYKFVIGLPLPGAVPWGRAAHLPSSAEILPCQPDTPALLTFTSGSTGQPKAALRTHGFLLAQHQVLAGSLGLAAGQVDLATMPIVTLANLASGVTSLIPPVDLRYPGTIDPALLVTQIQAARVVSTVASPALLERLARYCLQRGLTLPLLKKIFTGGAPVFPRLLEQLQQVAPQAEIVAVYGSTEAEPIAEIAWREMSVVDRQAMLAGRGLLVGPPVKAIRLGILPDRWGHPIGPYTEAEFVAACCPPEEAGEIVVSGDHVLPGYLHGHGDEETKFKVNGSIWHRTGDAGYMDRQGRVWLLGRCAARLEDEHGILYPFAAECAVYQNPDVRRAALVSHLGRRLMAVEFYHPAALSELARLKDTLAWAYIDEIRVCRHIPVDKRHNAKIDYQALRQLLTSR
ncbi:MAG: AMP-binding protein [Chloroflexi bacterium]|nr:AMP-binding protein [Chloroflexota bacterium]